MNHDLHQRINELIARAFCEDDADSDYQGNFADEGHRKAQYVVDDLRYRESQGVVQLERMAYFCIGGADGSEVGHVLSETSISKAVMIEISDEGAAAARHRASDLRRYEKEFVVFQGDATSLLDRALRVTDDWHESGTVDGLVCSAQGVLHELPSRSPGFDLPVFLGKLFRNPDWQTCAFYSREPSFPEGWPKSVRIRIPGLHATQLARFARYVCDRLRMLGNPQALASGWVDLPSPLAVETLHKLIRDGSVRRIGYELQEQLTGFDPLVVKESLQSLVEGMHVTVEHVTSAGFKAALRNYAVEYLGHDSESLPIPKTHSEVIGFKSAGPARPVAAAPSHPVGPPATMAEVKFQNPFGGKVSDVEVLEWLSQFKPDERPLMARLLSGFVYLSFDRVRTMVIELHDRLRTELGEALDRTWYVPMGGVARSGAFVTYLFRSLNHVPNKRCLPFEKVSDVVRIGDPVVLLDDLLASGHQAVQEWSSLGAEVGLATSSPAYLATLVACEPGRLFVEERTSLQTICALQISRVQEPLSSESDLFPVIEEREQVRRILEKYGRALEPQGPLGYAGSGLLIAFEHSVPDNSLPIFWTTSRGWKPLLVKGSPPRMDSIHRVKRFDPAIEAD